MRKVMVALAAGMLVVGFSGVLAQAEDKAAPAVPTMSVKALQKVAKPGGTVTVELYVSNVSDLGVYQFHVAASGGENGALTFEDGLIDVTRKDYVFSGSSSLPAFDKKGVRGGSVVMGSAGKNVTKPKYIGTATFRVSPEAKGTYEINVVANPQTFLRDSHGVPIMSGVGEAAKVSVVERIAPKRVKKDKR